MSWDIGAGSSWNEGGAATTFNEPAIACDSWQGGGADSFNKPASASHGNNTYGVGETNAYGGGGEDGDGFGGADGVRPSSGCFNCGEEG